MIESMMRKLSLNSVLKVPEDKKTARRKKTLQDHLLESYKNQMFVDVEIRVQNRIFKAHRCILAFYSPILQKAFYNSKSPPPLCVINDITPEGFDTLLKYIYSSKIPKDGNGSNLVQACIAAKNLEMIGMKNKLINDILKDLTIREKAVQQFWTLLEKSHLLKLKELEARLLKFAEANKKNVLMNEHFSKASIDIIKLVLNLKTLSISDCEKLERIAHWKESNSEFYEQPVQELLSCVKFERMSPAEFYTVASKHKNLIDGKDALDILMHLVDSTVCLLPSWCYLGDKHGNEKEDMSLNLNTQDLKDWSKTDDFKSLDDLRKCGKLKRPVSRRKANDFKSLEDCTKLGNSKSSLKDFCELHFDEKPEAKTLPESFQQMLEEELFTDVCLYDSNGVKIPAHRLILAIQSPYFASVLYTPTPNNTIRLEYTAAELKSLLWSFYGKSLKISSKQLYYVMRLYDIALKCDCYNLKKLCSTIFTTTTLKPGIVWILLQQCKHLKNYTLRINEIIEYVLTQPKNFFSHTSFLSAHKDDLIHILENECINMSEWDILEYVARWIENNSKDFPSVESRKEIFKYIRFEALSTEHFFSFLKAHDKLLLKEDAFAILTYLYKESRENSLPEWCYTGPLRRFYYHKHKKIGTNIKVPWTGKTVKDTNSLQCTYTATISNSLNECQIEYLDISWQHIGKKGKYVPHKCNMSIEYDKGELLTFINIDVPKHLRIIVPVFFTLSKQKPKIQFNIEVKTQACHTYNFLNQRKLTFENVIIESNSATCCVMDAIVDNCTSEKMNIPKHLLPQNRVEAVPTETLFGNPLKKNQIKRKFNKKCN